MTNKELTSIEVAVLTRIALNESDRLRNYEVYNRVCHKSSLIMDISLFRGLVLDYLVPRFSFGHLVKNSDKMCNYHIMRNSICLVTWWCVDA